MFPSAFIGGIGAPELLVILLVFSLPVALVLLAGIVAAARKEQPAADRALEELRIAYARGELDDEEFERRKQTLEAEREG